MKKVVFTPLDNGNIKNGSEHDFIDMRMLINYCDCLMNINYNHKPAYMIAIGATTYIDDNKGNILDFLNTFINRDGTIYIFEFTSLREALYDHLQYLTENQLI